MSDGDFQKVDGTGAPDESIVRVPPAIGSSTISDGQNISETEASQRVHETLLKQMELLNEQMKETAATANELLAKFIFGGIVATIAMLNVDLVLFKVVIDRWTKLVLLLGGSIAVFILAVCYFRVVSRRYNDFRLAQRKLKYKYELTLHALLLGAKPMEYSTALEASIDASPATNELLVPNDAVPFRVFAAYLQDHHRRRYGKQQYERPHLSIALLIVLMALSVRLSTYVVDSPLFQK